MLDFSRSQFVIIALKLAIALILRITITSSNQGRHHNFGPQGPPHHFQPHHHPHSQNQPWQPQHHGRPHHQHPYPPHQSQHHPGHDNPPYPQNYNQNQPSSFPNPPFAPQQTPHHPHPHHGHHISQLESDQSTFLRQALSAHNHYRALHGVPPLVLDATLTADALSWAKHSTRRPHAQIRHSLQEDRGENIFFVGGLSPRQISGDHPVKAWYDEIRHFSWTGNHWDMDKTGHFTAVVWKSTTKFGMAWAQGEDGRIVVVAQYQPPGNLRDDNLLALRENVPQVIRQF